MTTACWEQVLSLSAEEREAAEKQAAEVKAAAQVASTNPEQNGKAQPEVYLPIITWLCAAVGLLYGCALSTAASWRPEVFCQYSPQNH